MIVRKSRKELEAMREGGRITAACLEMLEENVKPGVTTRELDRLAEEFIYERGGKPEFKGYQGSPRFRLHLRLAERHDRARHPRLLPPEERRHHLPGRRRPLRGLRNRLGDHRPRRGRARRGRRAPGDHEGVPGGGDGADAGRQQAWRRGPRDTSARRVARLRGRQGPRLPRGRTPDARGPPDPELRKSRDGAAPAARA